MLLYRGLMSLAAPLFALWMAMRWVFGPETRITFLERLGWSRGRAPAGQTGLWVHAASNGELASVEPILRMLLARMPDLVILVTTNSQTGRDLAQGWELPRLHARVAPFDLRWCAARILRRWRVEALIVIESELWPNRLRATTNLGLPVLVLGARLSERTAKGWRKAWFLARHVLNDLTWILPQDADTAHRFRKLGVHPHQISSVANLKSLYTRPAPCPGTLSLSVHWPKDRTWLAASTHPGEDEIILEAHRIAREQLPSLKLLLAPRHPSRAADIAELIRTQGFSLDQRSAGRPHHDADVYLADTLGDMALLYDLTNICFVAGSMVEVGGHTPFEPLGHGCVILHGPHVSNFSEIYLTLDSENGAIQVEQAEDLAKALIALQDEPYRRKISNRGTALAARAGSIEAISTKIQAHLGRKAA